MLLRHLPATKELILLIDTYQRTVKNKQTLQQLDLLPFKCSCKGQQGVIYRSLQTVKFPEI
jgi:hypothetical protein